MPDTEIFYKEQQSWPLWMSLPILGLAIALLATLGVHVASMIVVSVFLIVGFLFGGLTTKVGPESVTLSFGVGIIKKSISLENIEAAEAVRNSWWYGFGIRLTPHGWMWNMNGLSAVESTYKTGKKFRIGTKNPEELLEALS